ncbi:MAG: hypothetical protein JWR53_1492 [Glaciihabitans sp.]|jgi:Flp pilus assembly protein TadG|nr:hypothetical protein [Glaciihabitans sp.]
MLPSKRWRDDRGSASLEFITVGLILLLPLVYLVLALAAIQAGSFGVEGAARQGARVFVQASRPTDAAAAASVAIGDALADYGLDPDTATVKVTCAPKASVCLDRRSFVTIRVTATVPLPLVPPAISAKLPLAVPLEATATQQVSRFWGAG